MSESVKIGGIGKNPAIDKINSLNGIDIRNFATNRMKQTVFSEDFDSSIAYGKRILLNLDQVDWEGKASGGEKRATGMAGNKLSGRKDVSKASRELYATVGRSDGGEVSNHSQTTGSV